MDGRVEATMKKTEFYVQAENLNRRSGVIIVEHRLWGKQTYKVEELEVINDNDRLGVCIHGCEIYLYKPEIILYNVNENTYVVADKNVQITIIVNNM